MPFRVENRGMMFAAVWMDLEMIIRREGSQKEKDKYQMTSLMCGFQHITQMNLTMKQNRLTDVAM